MATSHISKCIKGIQIGAQPAQQRRHATGPRCRRAWLEQGELGLGIRRNLELGPGQPLAPHHHVAGEPAIWPDQMLGMHMTRLVSPNTMTMQERRVVAPHQMQPGMIDMRGGQVGRGAVPSDGSMPRRGRRPHEIKP